MGLESEIERALSEARRANETCTRLLGRRGHAAARIRRARAVNLLEVLTGAKIYEPGEPANEGEPTMHCNSGWLCEYCRPCSCRCEQCKSMPMTDTRLSAR